MLPEAGSWRHLTLFGVSSLLFRKSLRRFKETLAWTKLEIRVGRVARGNRRTLKRERATNALSAVRRSLGLLMLTREKVAKVTRATCSFRNLLTSDTKFCTLFLTQR